MHEALQRFETILRDAPSRLQALGEEEAARGRAGREWTPKQELGHLIDSAANNHQRFVRAQLKVRYDGPGYEQNEWVDRQGYAETPWTDLVHLWEAYNRHLLRVLRRIPEETWAHECRIGGAEPVTLQFVAVDYVRHLQHHLDGILR